MQGCFKLHLLRNGSTESAGNRPAFAQAGCSGGLPSTNESHEYTNQGIYPASHSCIRATFVDGPAINRNLKTP